MSFQSRFSNRDKRGKASELMEILSWTVPETGDNLWLLNVHLPPTEFLKSYKKIEIHTDWFKNLITVVPPHGFGFMSLVGRNDMWKSCAPTHGYSSPLPPDSSFTDRKLQII